MSNRRWLFTLRTLPRVALAAAACTATNAAVAQTGNAANGQVLYRTDVVIENTPYACRDCHDPGALGRQLINQNLEEAGIASRIGAAINANRGGMGVYSALTVQQRTDIAAYLIVQATAPPPPPLAPPPPPPTPAASPNPLMFNSTDIGATSATTLIQITNTSPSPVSFHATKGLLTPVEGATTEFLPTVPPTGTWCATLATLPAGGSCMIGAQFRPQTPGTRSTVWIVNFANGVVTRSVTLEGTATGSAAPPPAPSPSPSPSPAPAPAPAPAPSAANPPTSGGGGASSWFAIGVLAAAASLRRRRT